MLVYLRVWKGMREYVRVCMGYVRVCEGMRVYVGVCSGGYVKICENI